MNHKVFYEHNQRGDVDPITLLLISRKVIDGTNTLVVTNVVSGGNIANHLLHEKVSVIATGNHNVD